jgi:hypothetical protein
VGPLRLGRTGSQETEVLRTAQDLVESIGHGGSLSRRGAPPGAGAPRPPTSS